MGTIPTYQDKLGLRDHLATLGISINWIKKIKDEPGAYYVEDGREQETIDAIAAYDELPAWQSQKTAEIKAEGISRLAADFPFLANWETIEFMVELWQSLVPAAKSPTPKFQNVIDIYSAGKTATVAVNALASVADVQAYDATIDPGW